MRERFSLQRERESERENMRLILNEFIFFAVNKMRVITTLLFPVWRKEAQIETK